MPTIDIDIIIADLKNAFDGSPWYGDALIEGIEKIDIHEVNAHGSSHSIPQLLKHIINWRIFVINKLLGEETYEVENDWQVENQMTLEEWMQLIDKLKATQIELMDILKDKNDMFLDGQVPGRNHDYRFLLKGITQHDIYHLGQILFRNAQLIKSR